MLASSGALLAMERDLDRGLLEDRFGTQGLSPKGTRRVGKICSHLGLEFQ